MKKKKKKTHFLNIIDILFHKKAFFSWMNSILEYPVDNVEGSSRKMDVAVRRQGLVVHRGRRPTFS